MKNRVNLFENTAGFRLQKNSQRFGNASLSGFFVVRGWLLYLNAMKKTTYVDKDGNELVFHINTKDELYVSAGLPDEDLMYKGYICLDKEDVLSLIKDLKRMLSEM